MASCSVTTGGTSGTFRLNYNLGVNPVIAYYNFGDTIFIDNSATDVTYTTLTGDVTATSGCVTITALPETCYLLKYDRSSTVNTSTSVFDAIVVGTTVHSFASPSADTLIDSTTLIYNINTVLADPNIKVVSVKSTNLTNNFVNIALIVKIIGTDIPSLRIKSINNNYSYIIGTVSSDCVPFGYYSLNICEPIAP